MESLAAGVPVVVCPGFADQPANAQKAAELQVGLQVTRPVPAEGEAGIMSLQMLFMKAGGLFCFRDFPAPGGCCHSFLHHVRSGGLAPGTAGAGLPHSSRRVWPKDHRGGGRPEDRGHPPPDWKGEAAADPPREHSPHEPHRQRVQGTGLIKIQTLRESNFLHRTFRVPRGHAASHMLEREFGKVPTDRPAGFGQRSSQLDFSTVAGFPANMHGAEDAPTAVRAASFRAVV